MKRLKDYLHFYIGQQMEWIENGNHFQLNARMLYHIHLYDEFKKFKLILTPINQETLPAEKISSLKLLGWCHFDENGCFVCDVHDGYQPFQMSQILKELRSAGYDCDQLIEAGLAIDKTKTVTA